MKKLIFGLLATAALLFGAGSANAAPIFFEDFNGETLGLGVSTLAQFSVVGNVDVIGTGFFDLYPGNGNYLDLDGSRGASSATITTMMSFAPGTYVLEFDIGSNGGPNSMLVTLGTYSETFTRTGSVSPLENISRTITLTSASTLSFKETTGPDTAGIILDNVSLSEAPPVRDASAVPEPASMSLLALGAAGMLGFRLRRRNKVVS